MQDPVPARGAHPRWASRLTPLGGGHASQMCSNCQALLCLWESPFYSSVGREDEASPSVMQGRWEDNFFIKASGKLDEFLKRVGSS